ncbi:NAD(P)-dependent alcohol dehydrogenase [Trichothermofontia sp.]
MQAIVIQRYGPPSVLETVEVDRPQPRSNEVLAQVHASSVNPVDWKIRAGAMKLLTGRQFPLRLGCDFAGLVTEVGAQVTQFRPGDAVYGQTGIWQRGAYAEWLTLSPTLLAPKPKNMTMLEAATVPLAGITALQALRDQGRLRAGQSVLINGAAGGVGSFAVQIAKAMGATVTGVCSGKNGALVSNLGADRVLDYTQTDITQLPDRYDLLFDAVSKLPFNRSRRLLKPNGIYVAPLPGIPNPEQLLSSFLSRILPGPRAILMTEQPNSQDLRQLTAWIEAGKVRAVIDRTYPLAEIAAAHTYSEQGHTCGKIAIEIVPAIAG